MSWVGCWKMHLVPYVHLLGWSRKFLHTDVRYCLLKVFFFWSSSWPWANPHPYSLRMFSHCWPFNQNLHSSVLTFLFHPFSIILLFFLVSGVNGSAASKLGECPWLHLIDPYLTRRLFGLSMNVSKATSSRSELGYDPVEELWELVLHLVAGVAGA